MARLSTQISNGMMALGGLGIILQFNTFWLLIVGIVLRIIAAGTYKTVQQSSKLTRPVHEMMVPTHHVRTLPITASIQDLQTTFLRHGYKVYPVMDGDTVIGLVHYQNVREAPPWLEASQGAIRPRVVPLRQELVVSSQTTLQEALDQMLQAGSNEVLVYSHDTFMGLVKRSMILRVQQSISEPGPMKKEDKPIGLPLWENRSNNPLRRQALPPSATVLHVPQSTVGLHHLLYAFPGPIIGNLMFTYDALESKVFPLNQCPWVRI
jgi:CBS domain-containing protein